jgi:hypothetical protein
VIGKIPGVRKTTTSIVPLVLKDVYQWRIPDSVCVKMENGMQTNAKEKIDGNQTIQKQGTARKSI